MSFSFIFLLLFAVFFSFLFFDIYQKQQLSQENTTSNCHEYTAWLIIVSVQNIKAATGRHGASIAVSVFH